MILMARRSVLKVDIQESSTHFASDSAHLGNIVYILAASRSEGAMPKAPLINVPGSMDPNKGGHDASSLQAAKVSAKAKAPHLCQQAKRCRQCVLARF